MVSVILGAAALSAALAGGYGLYKYWTRTDSAKLLPKRPNSPSMTPVDTIPEPSVRTPPPVAPKPAIKSPPSVAPNPSLRSRGVVAQSPPIKLISFDQRKPQQVFVQEDEPAMFDQVHV